MNLKSNYIFNLASKNQRTDGREFSDFRKIEIEENPIENSDGSARVRMGKTEVLVGVKLDVGEPFPDSKDEGILIVSAELSPLASAEFEEGPPREESIELARIVDRGIRESGAIDVKKLCVKEGEKVWMVNIDIHIINHDGNLIDAAALASIIALWNAKFPKYIEKEDRTEYGTKTDKELHMKYKPVAVTVYKTGKDFFLDPNIDEEEASTIRLTVISRDDDDICALQKGGTEPLTMEDVEKIFSLAVKKAAELRKLV